MNTNTWLVDFGVVKPNIPRLIAAYKHSSKTAEDDNFISEKNFYVYSESFVNEIKNLLNNPDLKPNQIYDIMLSQNKVPITKFGKIMTRNTFQGYAIGIKSEMGIDPRSYTSSSKVRKLIDSGTDDPEIIAEKLSLPIGYVRAIRKKYLRKLALIDSRDKKTEIRNKVPEMIRLYVDCYKSTIEIAKILGLSTNTIGRNLAKNGVKLRSSRDYLRKENV